jgi:hypothetical protein
VDLPRARSQQEHGSPVHVVEHGGRATRRSWPATAQWWPASSPGRTVARGTDRPYARARTPHLRRRSRVVEAVPASRVREDRGQSLEPHGRRGGMLAEAGALVSRAWPRGRRPREGGHPRRQRPRGTSRPGPRAAPIRAESRPPMRAAVVCGGAWPVGEAAWPARHRRGSWRGVDTCGWRRRGVSPGPSRCSIGRRVVSVH